MILGITGTNTDVGKTVVATALAQAVRDPRTQTPFSQVCYYKPVQTGEEAGAGDMFTLNAQVQVPIYETIRYPEPLAPNLAARRAGMRELNLEEVTNQARQLDNPDTLVLLEGAGGLLVRMSETMTLPDILRAVDAPLLVVTSLQLGSLNLAELTTAMAQNLGVHVAGIIGGYYPQPTHDEHANLAVSLNEAELANVTGVPYLGSLPRGYLDLDATAQTKARQKLHLEYLWEDLVATQ
ncbi:MAG: dethiobiotin synthase [Corynebacterium sp.]|nr:dethiobiotin synthase [Corynebacterium sp.]